MSNLIHTIAETAVRVLIEEEDPKTKLFPVLASHVINHPHAENRERERGERGGRDETSFLNRRFGSGDPE